MGLNRATFLFAARVCRLAAAGKLESNSNGLARLEGLKKAQASLMRDAPICTRPTIPQYYSTTPEFPNKFLALAARGARGSPRSHTSLYPESWRKRN
jgi:hypothetical protein